jgi:fused signal recognition particle receptor
MRPYIAICEKAALGRDEAGKLSEDTQEKPKAGLFRRLFGLGGTVEETPPSPPVDESPAAKAERELQEFTRLFGHPPLKPVTPPPAPKEVASPAPSRVAPAPEAIAPSPAAPTPLFEDRAHPEPAPLVLLSPEPEPAAPLEPAPPVLLSPEPEPIAPSELASPVLLSPEPEPIAPPEPAPPVLLSPEPEPVQTAPPEPAPPVVAPTTEEAHPSELVNEPAVTAADAAQEAPLLARGVLGRLFGRGETAPPPEPPIAETPEASPAPSVLGRLFGRAETPPEDVAEPEAPKRSWLSRLTFGLSRSSSAIGRGIVDIFTKRKLDETSLDDLEDILLQADLGLGPATRIREAIGKGRYEKGIDPDEVKRLLAEEVERTLTPVARPLVIDSAQKPFVILVVGVNGSGKTTTIGKLAAKFAREGRKVTLAAGDTFRAAAIEQLKIWAGRAHADIFAREQGGDAAGLAFDALTHARANGADVMLMDTAGRLQNRVELMKELEKVVRVMKKVDPTAPHATLLVLDATVGQNALSQVEIFGRTAGVTGLVMTKLDGTARGGILVAIADKHKLPVHFIGVGEQIDDLEPFAARDFAHAIAGIE